LSYSGALPTKKTSKSYFEGEL